MVGRPRIRAPRRWSLPPGRALRLDNGLQVLVYDRPGQYVVSAALVLDAPLTSEPADREGVAALVAATLDQGTALHPGTTFADAVEACGALIGATAAHTHTVVHLDVPGARLADAAPLFAEAVMAPQLGDDDIARHARLRLAHLDQLLASSSDRASLGLRHAVLAPSNRAQRLAAGERGTVTAVTGADARAHHARWYGPRGATLVVAGDFPAAGLDALLAAFAPWQNPGQPAPLHETLRPGQPGAFLLDRPGSVQADIRWGWFTVDRLDPRWFALQIASHALGGAYLSRLNKVLREERGFTYGAGLMSSPQRGGGFTTTHGSFRNEVVGPTLELLGPLLDVGAAPITAAEVARARDYLVGVTPLRYATAGGLTDAVVTLLGAGLGPNFIDLQLDRWRSVTPEDATRAAHELVRPDGGTLVVVGDAAALAAPIRAAGWNPVVLGPDAA
ncbi:M16 family metallopeptidase [Propioniciclava soli]|uniref:M16 family metallopeptidase n=1 Tax=Propioniciclava soli TaxID=2775081 RepID=UPI001E642F34|nr:pitrilysin family protein [Propioniciclava soli]